MTFKRVPYLDCFLVRSKIVTSGYKLDYWRWANYSNLEGPLASTGLLSRPKPDTRICDHDRHANIKPKPDINKNQLNFYKTFPKASLFLFILVSLLLHIIFHLIVRASTPYSKYNIIHQSFNFHTFT